MKTRTICTLVALLALGAYGVYRMNSSHAPPPSLQLAFLTVNGERLPFAECNAWVEELDRETVISPEAVPPAGVELSGAFQVMHSNLMAQRDGDLDRTIALFDPESGAALRTLLSDDQVTRWKELMSVRSRVLPVVVWQEGGVLRAVARIEADNAEVDKALLVDTYKITADGELTHQVPVSDLEKQLYEAVLRGDQVGWEPVSL